ncbi:MAG: MarR family transcriptional regulator [Actinomycetota bacterium]
MKENEEQAGGTVEQAARMLIAATRLTHGMIMTELREVGLRPPQAAFLAFMHQTGPLRMSDLSRFANITSSVATRFVERLEDRGMVERVPDEHDRRVVLVRLSDEGKSIAEHLLETYTARLEESLEGVEPDELDAFLRVLALINQHLAEKLDLSAFVGMLGAHGPRGCEEEHGEGHEC